MNNKKRAAFLVALLWTLLILILLVIPGKDIPPGPQIPNLDKIAHVFLFGVQVFLWSKFISESKRNDLPGRFLVICLMSSAFGIMMEFVQKYLVPNRSFEIEDILADILGSVMGWLLYRFFFYPKHKRG